MLPPVYLRPPLVRANLVQDGEQNFVDDSGSSRGISNELDRDRLLLLRALSDVVVTDGETARRENYRIPSTTDLAVITKLGYQPPASTSEHRYIELKLNPSEAIESLLKRGYQRILLEVGPNILLQLVQAKLVDELCLTISGRGVPALKLLGIEAATLSYQEVVQDTTFTVWREIRAL